MERGETEPNRTEANRTGPNRIPMLRTLVSIPAGVVKMELPKYILSSVCGIFIWNFVFVGAGYVLGDQVFRLFGAA